MKGNQGFGTGMFMSRKRWPRFLNRGLYIENKKPRDLSRRMWLKIYLESGIARRGKDQPTGGQTTHKISMISVV